MKRLHPYTIGLLIILCFSGAVAVSSYGFIYPFLFAVPGGYMIGELAQRAIKR